MKKSNGFGLSSPRHTLILPKYSFSSSEVIIILYSIKIRHPSKTPSKQHDGKERQHKMRRDKDSIKDQTQIWTDTDKTKLFAQHEGKERQGYYAMI